MRRFLRSGEKFIETIASLRKFGAALLLPLAACALLEQPAWPSRSRPALARHRAVAQAGMVPRVTAGQPSSLDIGQSVLVPADEVRIQRQRVCVAAPNWSSGTLGEVVLYRYQRVGNELYVGYFVYWTNERPWGKNGLTYSLVPALLIDAAYSHFAFVLPGLRHAIHGAGDVEGAQVIYEVGADGKLSPKRAFADDGLHRDVELSRRDILMPDGSVVLLTDVWSHQLGGREAARYATAANANVRCFSHDALQPLTSEIAGAFRLGTAREPRRARPAWRAPPPSSH